MESGVNPICETASGAGESPRSARAGFVLAEIITVAVIVGILAAVAIPVYTGYVRNEKQATTKALAESGAAAANIYYRRTGEAPPDSAALRLFISDPTRYQVDVDGDTIEVRDISGSSPITARVGYK